VTCATIKCRGGPAEALPPFRLVDHTADLAIEASAPSEAEALAEAALGFTSVLTGKADPHLLGAPDTTMEFSVEAPDRPSLLVAFLSELLWQFESNDLLWLGGGVTLRPGPDGTIHLEARGNAQTFDAAKHGRGVEVKAVTYHDLEYAQAGREWRLRVVVDI
jgi:SHS2 domain-containing protein